MKVKKTRKQVILEESAILFNEKGYSATSMQDIASKCGIRASSLYNHIKSKQEILSFLLLDIADKFYNGIIDVNNSSNPYKEKLQEIIKRHIRVAMENQNITSLINQDWKQLEEPSLSEFLKIRNNYQVVFRQVIENGMNSKELKFKNIDITLNVILSSLRWIYNTKINVDTSSSGITELEKTILDIVFKGIEV